MEKDFDKWNVVKQTLHHRRHKMFVKEREVWWCSIGVNVGHEENGKNETYERPVLILRKMQPELFLAVPLSTKLRESISRFEHRRKEKNEAVLLGQLRILSTSRLQRRMWRMAEGEFEEIKKQLKDLI